MRPWLKNLLLLAALSLATWTAVIAAWYAQRRVVSLDDVLQYLLALPLLLFAGVLVLRGRPRGAPATPPAQAATAAAFDAATPATAQAADTGAPCPVLGAWVHTAAGADLPTLLAALAEGRPRPGPDAQLRDLDGLPVLSARIAALDPAAVQAALPPHVRLSDAALRALAALSPLLDQAVDALADVEATAEEAADEAGGHARPGPAPDLHVLACWPATWSDAEAQVAQAWLARRLEPLAVTLARIAGTGAELLLQAQAHLHQIHRAGHAGRVLALACHSDLDDAAVQRLEHSGRLYAMPRCPRGVMPGEAAAALLLATPALTPLAGDVGAPALLALRAQPQAPTAESGRRGAVSAAQAAPLQAQLDAALAACGLEPTAIACLCADADQHGPAAAPLYALAQSALPHLDALEDVRLTGVCCGHTGAVAPLLAVAVAWGQCTQGEKPAAAVSLTENGWWLASVLGRARR